jgi:hypothetical protein
MEFACTHGESTCGEESKQVKAPPLYTTDAGGVNERMKRCDSGEGSTPTVSGILQQAIQPHCRKLKLQTRGTRLGVGKIQQQKAGDSF